ncbi:hypothetical protein [Streptomyces sp. AcE210]|uniref:hypothetical protein n=1 Tax=Streptomyces sp. AcE210 TaxID=2292703 RepID=UPI001F0C9CA2|nr:hypothetical protein [Streptomyces sp. AcE210]
MVPPRPDAGDEPAIAQYEQDRERLSQAVFAAVGDPGTAPAFHAELDELVVVSAMSAQ